jgi:hypothetical protein
MTGCPDSTATALCRNELSPQPFEHTGLIFGPCRAIRLVRILVVTRNSDFDATAHSAEQPARSGQTSYRWRT